MSKVMGNATGYVKFPINEPAEGPPASPRSRSTSTLPGPGVSTSPLPPHRPTFSTGRQMQQQESSSHCPPLLLLRVAESRRKIDEPIEELERSAILVDRDNGYMLQIFTRP